MKHSAPQSAKFRKFVRILRPLIACESVSIDTVAIGILERLWHTTIVSAPQGDIGRIENEVIAELVGWHREPSELVTALVDSGFVDHCSRHRLVVHDWQDHAPAFVKGNLNRHNREFVETTQPNSTQRDATQRDATQPNRPKGGQQVAKQAGQQAAKQTSDSQFESFWEAYPSGRKSGKKATRKAWDIATQNTPAKTIIDASAEYSASDVGQGEFVKSPAAWLNQGCWDDDRAAWKEKNHTNKTFNSQKTNNTMTAVSRFIENPISIERTGDGKRLICN